MKEFWWTAIAQYLGRKTFMYGSIKATGEEHARVLFIELWDTISPYPAPEIVAVLKGRLVIQKDESE